MKNWALRMGFSFMLLAAPLAAEAQTGAYAFGS